jgi:hypothetical protein
MLCAVVYRGDSAVFVLLLRALLLLSAATVPVVTCDVTSQD